MMSLHEYQVSVDVTLARDISEKQLLQVLDALAQHDASVAGLDDDLGATLTITAASPHEASLAACDAVEKALGSLPVTVDEWRAVEVLTTAEADRRLKEPTIPELVGPPEVAEILRVARQRVHQLLADRADFPRPVVVTRSTSLWTRAAIDAFAQRWERKPGRPRKLVESTVAATNKAGEKVAGAAARLERRLTL